MTPRDVVLEAVPTGMKPEGEGSPGVVPSMLTEGCAPVLADGIPRAVAGSNQGHGVRYHLPYLESTYRSK